MTTTPDMNLVLPDPLITTGPTWATYLNAALTLVDSHDHSTGKGVAITPSGINISGDLTFNQNNATNIRAARFYNNSAITLGINDKSCLYALNNELHYVDGAGNDVQITLNGALDLNANITSLTLKDSSFYLEYFGDITKKFRFDAASIPTGTTRILSIPESGANDTLVSLAATQSLTNKTIGAGNVLTGSTIASFVSGSGTLTAPGVTDTLATLASSQTLTNKILTGNTVANVKPDGVNTLTFPAVTQTVATLAGSETLTNKVLTGNTAVNLISGTGTAVLNTSGTVTLPNATDTLVGKATTDVLTNKSFNNTVTVLADNGIQFNNTGNTFSTTLKAGANVANTVFTLPIADGSPNYVLTTDGSGNLSFQTVPAGSQATATTLGSVKGGTVPGTTATTNIAAGYLGETFVANATSIAGTAGYVTVASITLTAGQWDISASLYATLNANDYVIGSISDQTNSLPTVPQLGENEFLQAGASTGAASISICPQRYKLSGSTTYYLVAGSGASSTAAVYYGTIRAVRAG